MKCKYKFYFGMFAIGVTAILQGYAWYMGKNGMITGLVCLVIGGITGAIFGFDTGYIHAVKQKDPPISVYNVVDQDDKKV